MVIDMLTEKRAVLDAVTARAWWITVVLPTVAAMESDVGERVKD
jgi:hypothetical protein